MGVLLQSYATFASSFGTALMAIVFSWPSYTLEFYTAKNTTLLPYPMTETEVSLLGSLPSLGGMIGTAIMSPIINKIGRQKGGVLFSMPYALAWVMVYLAPNSAVIIAARFIMGIAGGTFLVYGPIVISETAQDSIRGFLATATVFFNCAGNLVSYLLGWFLSYRTIIWVNICFGVLSTILCYFLVESPIYLVRLGKDKEARIAIAKYRGGSPYSKPVTTELNRLKASINPAIELSTINNESEEKKIDDAEETLQPKKSSENKNAQNKPKMSAIKLLFVSPSSRRAFAVVFTHITGQVFMGVVPVTVYAKTLFAEAAPALSGHVCSVLFASMECVGAIVTAVIADRAGRRVLLITGSALVGLSMLSLGFFTQTKLGPAWIPAPIILTFVFCFYIGAGSIPYVLLAESFIPEVQGIASMLILEWVWFINFAIIAIFPVANRLIGIYGTFYIFATVALTNAVIGYIWVPETKGLSNEQIQEVYLKRRK